MSVCVLSVWLISHSHSGKSAFHHGGGTDLMSSKIRSGVSLLSYIGSASGTAVIGVSLVTLHDLMLPLLVIHHKSLANNPK